MSGVSIKVVGVWVCVHCCAIVRGESKALAMRIRLHNKSKHPGLPTDKAFQTIRGDPDGVDNFTSMMKCKVVAGVPWVATCSTAHMRRMKFRKDVSSSVEKKGYVPEDKLLRIGVPHQLHLVE